MQHSETQQVRRRGQGRHAGLDRQRIAEAARGISHDSLSIQAVADVLGVDRKAVNYHVGDLKGLLELVAVDGFTLRFAQADIDPTADWQTVCRHFATSMHDCLVATGALVNYFTFNPGDPSMLEPADIVMGRLYAAGFTDPQIGHAMTLLVNIAMATAHDNVMVSAARHPPSDPPAAAGAAPGSPCRVPGATA
ncbi:hypothetical protein ACRJ4B_10170 [Streptomyces sp. GTA36]